MKIIRDGVEIPLTEKEMIDAYFEQEHNFDVEYITENLLEQYVDEDSNPEETQMRYRLQHEPELADRVAYRYREYLSDSYGSDVEWESLRDAYRYMCRS